MAVPPVVNTVGAGIDSSVPTVRFESTNPTRKTQRFARTFQHYISNNNESSGPTITNIAAVANVNPAAKSVKEGWYHLPYTYSCMALTQAQRDMIIVGAKRMRVIDAGFEIKRIVAMQQETIPASAGTRVTNTFVQAPAAMVFQDTDNDMFEWTYDANEVFGAASTPIWQSSTTLGPKAPNNQGRSVFGIGAGGGTAPLLLTQFIPGGFNPSGTTNPDDFSLMNGGDITLVQSGEKFGYTWKNPVAQWQSPNQRRGTATEVLTGQPQFDWQPLTNAGALSASAFPDDIVSLYENIATELTQNVWNGPKMHLIRVPPLFNAAGAVNTIFELYVEYHMTVEWEDGRYLYGRGNQGTDSLIANGAPLNAWPTSGRVVFQQFDPAANRVDPEMAQVVAAAKNKYRNSKF